MTHWNSMHRPNQRGPQYLPSLAAPQANEEQKLQVLVADADTPARTQLVHLLARDCQVVCAETMRRAGWLVHRYHFDLVICDEELPHSGGMALLHYVEILAPMTVVVLLTAHLDRQVAIMARKYGAFGCYVKPLTAETVQCLLSVVRDGFPTW
jgi:DNA-binding NtrC family response regulator